MGNFAGLLSGQQGGFPGFGGLAPMGVNWMQQMAGGRHPMYPPGSPMPPSPGQPGGPVATPLPGGGQPPLGTGGSHGRPNDAYGGRGGRLPPGFGMVPPVRSPVGGGMSTTAGPMQPVQKRPGVSPGPMQRFQK